MNGYGRKTTAFFIDQLGIGDAGRIVEKLLKCLVAQVKKLRIVDDTRAVNIIKTDFQQTCKRHYLFS